MISKAFETIKKYSMLDCAKKVTVGFSGGADSVALLHFLYFFASDKEKNFKITAVHVNHDLRGEESKRDEDFAVSFCKKFGIEVIVKKVNVNEFAKVAKTGLEEAGRKARYEIFKSLSKEAGTKIATAHTLSDSCETFILNFIRGTALKGLCGIPPVRGNIIRPLINVTRDEIEEYCEKNNLTYIHDSSNFQKNYTRNKIRLDIIPHLKSINPCFENAAKRTLNALEEDEKYLNAHAEEAFNSLKNKNGYSIEKLKNLPDSIKNRVIVKIIKNFTDKSPEHKHINLISDIINELSFAATLPGNIKIINKDGNLQIIDKTQKSSLNWEYPLNKLNFLTEIGTNIIIKVITFSEYKKLKSESSRNVTWAFDFEKLPEGSVIRNRKPGDKFTLPFRNITKSVKKLFSELKIPEHLRNDVPLIAFENEIIWADNIGASKNYIPNDNTKKIAIICKEPKGI